MIDIKDLAAEKLDSLWKHMDDNNLLDMDDYEDKRLATWASCGGGSTWYLIKVDQEVIDWASLVYFPAENIDDYYGKIVLLREDWNGDWYIDGTTTELIADLVESISKLTELSRKAKGDK